MQSGVEGELGALLHITAQRFPKHLLAGEKRMRQFACLKLEPVKPDTNLWLSVKSLNKARENLVSTGLDVLLKSCRNQSRAEKAIENGKKMSPATKAMLLNQAARSEKRRALRVSPLYHAPCTFDA